MTKEEYALICSIIDKNITQEWYSVYAAKSVITIDGVTRIKKELKTLITPNKKN